MQLIRGFASLGLLITLAAGSSVAETILIRNATVLTVTKGTVEDGSVLIENGKSPQSE